MKKRKKSFILRYDLERLLTLGYRSNIPQRQLVLGYLSYIVVGTLLLSLSFATRTSISFIDNLFTISSAVSTTGLSTVNTACCYTSFGGIGYPFDGTIGWIRLYDHQFICDVPHGDVTTYEIF